MPRIPLFFPLIGGLSAAATLLGYGLQLHGRLPFLKDKAGFIIGRELFNTWFYGHAAIHPDPGRFYEHAAYVRWFSAAVPQNSLDHLWSYPPQFLILATPFGQFPYLAALALWSLAGLVALWLAVQGPARQSFAALVSPPAIICLISGEISLLVAAALIGVLRNLDRRPALASALIACVTIKPQAGVLIPLLLIVTRRWRVLAMASAFTVLLFALTTWIWGPGLWREYLTLGVPAQMHDFSENSGRLAPVSLTVRTAALMLGLGASWATAIQGVATALGVLLVCVGAGSGPLDARRCVLFLACSAFASPYLLLHDLTALTAAAVMMAASIVPSERRAAGLIYLLIPLQQLSESVKVPIAAVALVGVGVWAALPQVRARLGQLRRSGRSTS